MNEKYLDALYRFHELIEEDFTAFVKDTEKKGLTEGRIKYADCMMHLAKNTTKEILAAEGMDPEEMEQYSGNQGYGRAIRTTPGLDDGMSGNGQTGNGQTGRSMRSGARSGHTAYSGDGNNSGRRDSRGRYASSGANEDIFSKMQKMADMTTNHDEREIIMRMIDRIKSETEQ